MVILEQSDRSLFKKMLQDAAYKLEITVNENQIELLIQYLELLIKWNKAFNCPCNLVENQQNR